jgi:hypothetical protein
MHTSISALILSEKIAKVSTDALAIYLLLHSDISENSTVTAKFFKNQQKLISGFSVHSIAQHLGLEQLSVENGLDQLLREGWVKRIKIDKGMAYQLGEITDEAKISWFVNIERKKIHKGSIARQIKGFLDEKKERNNYRRTPELPRHMKLKLAETLVGQTKLKGNSVISLLEYFRAEYVKKFLVPYEIEEYDESGREYAKACGMIKRFLQYCNDSYDKAKTIIDFLFSNWEKLETLFDWEGYPNVSFLATKSIVRRLKEYKALGIPEVKKPEDRVAKRFDSVLAKEGPDEGF